MLKDRVEVDGDLHKNRDESPRRVEWTLSFFIIELKTFFFKLNFFFFSSCYIVGKTLWLWNSLYLQLWGSEEDSEKIIQLSIIKRRDSKAKYWGGQKVPSELSIRS